MSKSDTFVTTSSAARILGVTSQTVRRLIKDGDLPASRLENGYNGKFIIKSSEVEHLKTVRALQRAGK